MYRPLAILALLLAAALALPVTPDAAQAIDGAHVSHIPWLDLRPRCPVDQQSFRARLKARAGDVASVRVRFTDGAGTWVNANRIVAPGPYDVWEATLPASSHALVRYYFELNGSGTRAFWGSSGFADAPPADSGFAVDFASLAHAPPGATPVTNGVVFRVWAPTSSTAWVRGEFNGWTLANPLTKSGGDFIARVNGALVGQQYKFFFDTGTWNIDPRARVYAPATGLQNSVIADPDDYAWTNGGAFATPPVGKMVIEQVNVGTFSGLNDPTGAAPFPAGFVDAAKHAKDLAAVGVNAVMLNPVTLSPNLTFAGYECMTPWTLDWMYGTPAQFKAMVDTFHQNGIAVLCDIVWNHVPPTADVLWNYNGTQIYFGSPVTQTPWGEQADFSVPGVADFYEQSALQTLEEYHVDGFRMDAVSDMAIGTMPAAGWTLMQRLNDDIARRWMDKITIAEQLDASGPVLNPTRVGGAGFTAQYGGQFAQALQYTMRLSQRGPVYPWAMANLPVLPQGFSTGHQFMNYLELHDDAWGPANHRLARTLQLTPGAMNDSIEASVRLALGTVLLTPGLPAILMGDEWAEDNDWGTTAANRIDWAKQLLRARDVAWAHDAIAMRKSVPALAADAPSVLTHTNYNDGVMGWMRYDDAGQVYFCVANFGNQDFPSYLIGAPLAGTWVEQLNSQSAAYGGTGLSNTTLATHPRSADGFPQTLDMRLPRKSLLVFRALATTGIGPVTHRATLRIESIAPDPSPGATTVAFTLPQASPATLDVYDLRGARVARIYDGSLAAGRHISTWDGHDTQGRAAAGGLYFVRLQTSTGAVSRKLAIVR